VIGRREAIATVALAPLMPSAAAACMVQLPLPDHKMDQRLQARRVATVKSLFSKVRAASSKVGADVDKAISGVVRNGFSLPMRPAPFEMKSVAAFDDIVMVRAHAFLSTPDSECNPVTSVNAYYACFFDPGVSDRVAMMDTITYG
jgi:hypothetical protein